jgi:hypothetical protein
MEEVDYEELYNREKYAEACMEAHYMLLDRATEDMRHYYKREPTEDEIEDYMECLRDKYYGSY